MVGNLMALQNDLQRLTDPQLMQEMQNPQGQAPQYLILSELKRRQELRQGTAPTGQQLTTVTQDILKNQQQPLQRANFPAVAGNPMNMGQPGMTPAARLRGPFEPGPRPASAGLGSIPQFAPNYKPQFAAGGVVRHYDVGGMTDPLSGSPMDYSGPDPTQQSPVLDLFRKVYLPSQSKYPAIDPQDFLDYGGAPQSSSVGPAGSHSAPIDIRLPPGLDAASPPKPPGTPSVGGGIANLRPPSSAIPPARSYADILASMQGTQGQGQNTILDRLEQMRQDSKSTQGFNRNMALAELGFGMASSKSPFFAQAVGEGGLRAINALGKAEEGRRAEELKSLGIEASVADAQAAREQADRHAALTASEEEQNRASTDKYRQADLGLRTAELNKPTDFMKNYQFYAGLKDPAQQEAALRLLRSGTAIYGQKNADTHRLAAIDTNVKNLQTMRDQWNLTHPNEPWPREAELQAWIAQANKIAGVDIGQQGSGPPPGAKVIPLYGQ